MNPRKSAGILLYRIKNDELQIYIVHPGGPVFAKRDLGAWSIPKGEIDDGEEHLDCAIREVKEEIGLTISTKNFIYLNSITQKSGKIVYAWALEHNDDIILDNSQSHFKMMWPPKSGIWKSYPEVDQGEFFPVQIAKEKINSAQVELIERLEHYLNITKKKN